MTRLIIAENRFRSLKESIRIVFQRFHLIDSKMFDLIDKFYPEEIDSNEKNLSMKFIEYLEQQSFDEKLRFEHRHIFEMVRLYFPIETK